ncbi:unnamed protein product [Moneuplotes crassus]|uniref:Homeobox domain-containing protein n=1 Tax=Euplotes crassus TaxID=5936 RepID=A0AAD1U9M9_EUPCR|nr:unnamed protein product [Moneuplotes crassus]
MIFRKLHQDQDLCNSGIAGDFNIQNSAGQLGQYMNQNVKICKTTKKPRKYTKKENFSSECLRVLNHWIDQNIDFPYPTQEQLEQLSMQTGLMEKQIRIWCTNTRKRRLKITREDYLKKHNQNFNRQVQKKKFEQEMNVMHQGYSQKLSSHQRDLYSLPFPMSPAPIQDLPTSYDLSPSASGLSEYLSEVGYCTCDLQMLSFGATTEIFGLEN